jgi:hypothetical protein
VIAKSGTIRRRRTAKRRPSGWNSRNSAAVAASTPPTKKLNKLGDCVIADWAIGFQSLNGPITKSLNGNRGVSSTVKLSVSKTELGGSNPSAPARVLEEEEKEQGQE